MDLTRLPLPIRTATALEPTSGQQAENLDMPDSLRNLGATSNSHKYLSFVLTDEMSSIEGYIFLPVHKSDGPTYVSNLADARKHRLRGSLCTGEGCGTCAASIAANGGPTPSCGCDSRIHATSD
ncbi:hypothetical protein EVAR_17343_1 [Eumeta japonica]|uniref:Uncharacterized protein n=1 Tax=Eumeta variegata TaxID=151549 RepID=A0A4C1WHT1_EUMVA|nr:hypothetical protein EVAR_17343_1 [Eumeta japonica]